jgi:hypothetical protein
MGRCPAIHSWAIFSCPFHGHRFRIAYWCGLSLDRKSEKTVSTQSVERKEDQTNRQLNAEPGAVEAVNKFENLVILEWHPITEPRAVAIGCKHSTNLITSLMN